MTVGDSKAEATLAAPLHAEAEDARRASIALAHQADEKRAVTPAGTASIDGPRASDEALAGLPTTEEMNTLRRVAGPIPLKVFTIAVIELCERFSYYGCTVVCKSNLLNAP
jgi:POT family proton-dependent oligopeptide transporter